MTRAAPMPGYATQRLGRAGAPRFLLLHGFTGGRGDWSPWPANAPPAIAIDLPGHGESPDPAGDFGAEIVRLLAAVPPAVDRLVGYSLGGRIALSLLAAAPERFAAATIASAHPGLADGAERETRRGADGHWIRLLREQGVAAFVDAWEEQPLFASQRALPPAVRRAQRGRRLAQRAEGLARSLECFGLAEMPDTRDALLAYSGRLDCVVGALDGKFKALAQDLVGRRRRHGAAGAVHELAGIGHNVLREAPERLLEIVGVR
jgi:2-succinyl-6-hydroxy-2,4-cyclohexadiene-1-carboxylate synthase